MKSRHGHLDLYRHTLRGSYKALMGAVGLRKSLEGIKALTAKEMLQQSTETPDNEKRLFVEQLEAEKHTTGLKR